MEISEPMKELKRRVKCANQREVALALGVTPQFINDVLRGRRDMSENLAKGLGYIKVINYVKVVRNG
jgi:plasmid maintenance system antidote protein VapI